MQLEKLSDKQRQPESQLKFIIEAWQQVKVSVWIQFSFRLLICLRIIDLLLLASVKKSLCILLIKLKYVEA